MGSMFFLDGTKKNGTGYNQCHLMFDDIQYMPSIVLDHEDLPVNNTGRDPCLHGAAVLIYILKESSWLLRRPEIKGETKKG